MTHDELVRRAVRWLKSPCRPKGVDYSHEAHGVVVPELVSYASETPDAIGWKGCLSTLVECKTSRTDFLADRHKPCRRRGKAVGARRFLLCQPEVLSAADIEELRQEPHHDDWGLLYCLPKRILVVVPPRPNPRWDAQDEIRMLYSLLRRVEARGLLTRCLAPKWGGEGLPGASREENPGGL